MNKFEKLSIILFLIFIVLSFLTGVFLIFGHNFKSLTTKKEKTKEILKIAKSVSINSPGVTVVSVYGPITITGVQSGFMSAGGSDALIRKLDKIQKDKKIKAIILRINSPGGTIGSVQEIYAKLLKLKKNNIKIVVSMADIAASGGYYIACAADKIIANPGTLTGSIGVIMESLDYSELFKKWGLKQNVIKSGKHKDIMSGHRPMTANERKLLQDVINDSYEQFLDVVSKNRKIPKSKLRKIADGRIFDGRLAKKAKLVDELGTFEDAIAEAKKIAHLPKHAPVYKTISNPWYEIVEQINSVFNKRTKTLIPLSHQFFAPLDYMYKTERW